MMHPPPFSGIGSKVTNILNSSFDLDFRSFTFSSTTGSIECGGRFQNPMQFPKWTNVRLHVGYSDPQAGLRCRAHSSSHGDVSLETFVDNAITNGVSNRFTVVHNAYTAKTRAFISSCYHAPNVSTSLNFDFSGPVPNLTHWSVVALGDYLMGLRLRYNSQKGVKEGADLAFAYASKDFGFHGIIKDWSNTFVVGMFQQISNRLQFAGELSWARNSPSYYWAAAFQWALDRGMRQHFKAKLDHRQRLSVSLRCRLNAYSTVFVAAMISDPDDARVGFGLDIAG